MPCKFDVDKVRRKEGRAGRFFGVEILHKAPAENPNPNQANQGGA